MVGTGKYLRNTDYHKVFQALGCNFFPYLNQLPRVGKCPEN